MKLHEWAICLARVRIFVHLPGLICLSFNYWGLILNECQIYRIDFMGIDIPWFYERFSRFSFWWSAMTIFLNVALHYIILKTRKRKALLAIKVWVPVNITLLIANILMATRDSAKGSFLLLSITFLIDCFLTFTVIRIGEKIEEQIFRDEIILPFPPLTPPLRRSNSSRSL